MAPCEETGIDFVTENKSCEAASNGDGAAMGMLIAGHDRLIRRRADQLARGWSDIASDDIQQRAKVIMLVRPRDLNLFSDQDGVCRFTPFALSRVRFAFWKLRREGLREALTADGELERAAGNSPGSPDRNSELHLVEHLDNRRRLARHLQAAMEAPHPAARKVVFLFRRGLHFANPRIIQDLAPKTLGDLLAGFRSTYHSGLDIDLECPTTFYNYPSLNGPEIEGSILSQVFAGFTMTPSACISDWVNTVGTFVEARSTLFPLLAAGLTGRHRPSWKIAFGFVHGLDYSAAQVSEDLAGFSLLELAELLTRKLIEKWGRIPCESLLDALFQSQPTARAKYLRDVMKDPAEDSIEDGANQVFVDADKESQETSGEDPCEEGEEDGE